MCSACCLVSSAISASEQNATDFGNCTQEVAQQCMDGLLEYAENGVGNLQDFLDTYEHCAPCIDLDHYDCDIDALDDQIMGE